MNVLAFDTCFAACSAAILRYHECDVAALADEHTRMTRGHAEALLPMVQRVLETADLTLEKIDRIAVTTGPGTFTGVRVAIAVARALTLATDIPLIGIGTLEAMAQTAERQHDNLPGNFAIIRDARRDQVYLQSFACVDGKAVPTMAKPVICAPEQVPLMLPEPVAAAIGSGAPLVPWPEHALPEIIETDVEVSALAVAELARDRKPTTGPLSPLYLRAPDAKPQSGFALQWQAN